MSCDRRHCGRETRWRESEAEGVPLTNSNPAKMLVSGIWATWTRAHVSGHCSTILIRQNVGIGYMNWMDLGPSVWTLCNNSYPAKMSELDIWAEWTRAHVSGHCVTNMSGLNIMQKSMDQVFKQSHLGPKCLGSLQQFWSLDSMRIGSELGPKCAHSYPDKLDHSKMLIGF